MACTRSKFGSSRDFFCAIWAEAVHLLFDERKVHVEAIVAANDYMALDAMQALQARGFVCRRTSRLWV